MSNLFALFIDFCSLSDPLIEMNCDAINNTFPRKHGNGLMWFKYLQLEIGQSTTSM